MPSAVSPHRGPLCSAAEQLAYQAVLQTERMRSMVNLCVGHLGVCEGFDRHAKLLEAPQEV